MRSIYPKQSEKMINRFKDNKASFEWLPIFKRGQKEHSHSLYDRLRQILGMRFDLCKVRLCKDYKISTITEYILKGKKDSIYICVLKDEEGGNIHAVGINLKLGLIYDCMETHELVLNIDNLSRCCGNGKKLKPFMIQAKLK